MVASCGDYLGLRSNHLGTQQELNFYYMYD